MNFIRLNNFFRQYWILILLVTLKMSLQYFLVNPVYELQRDEFMHLEQAFHPAAGYISVPPFSSWIAVLIYLLGGSLFWIRFFPAMFGALTLVIVWLTVEEIGGKLPAKLLASMLIIFSVLLRINVLFQPNSFDILAWTAVFYLLTKYINSKQQKWLFLLSVVIAFGLYNKYNIVFLLAGIFAGLWLTPQRELFSKKTFYLAMAFCLILFLPNIIWQIKFGFPVFHHMKALNDRQLIHVNRMDFLIDQVKYGLLGIVSCSGILALFLYKPFKQWRFVAWTFLSTVALFTLARAKTYYAVGLYPVFFAFGSVYLEAVLKKWKTIFIPVLVISRIVIFILIAKYLMPVQSPAEIIANHETYEKIGLLRWEDGKNHSIPQDFADMTGWKEMAEKALLAYQQIPAEELSQTLIFCNNYGQTGAVNFYNRGKMPPAYAFNTDYIYWMPRLTEIKNVVLIGEKPKQEIVDLFNSVKLIGMVENEYSREKGTPIYLLTGAKTDIAARINQEAADRIKTFDLF